MRSSIFSGAALLASLLVREAAAAPLERRALVIEDVLVTEMLTVVQEADGSYSTQNPVAVGTSTIQRAPSSSSEAPVAPAPSTSSSSSIASVSSSAAVFVEIPKTTSTPAPTTTPVAIKVAEPATTLATSTTPAAAANPIASVMSQVSSAVSSVVAPIASAISGGSTSSGGKRGLAYNDASLLEDFAVSGSKTTWAYNWGSGTASIPSGLEFVPMLWGLGEHVNGWKAAASSAIASGSTHLLGFNEPDLGAQSNISPADAATGWSNMQQFAGQAKLGSPAITNGGAPMGTAWLTSFLSACSGCTVDFVACHWYDSASNFEYFKQHVSDVYEAGGNRPLWITEFGASGSTDEQNAFLEKATAYLDSLDYVERYAYFMVQQGSLVDGSTLSKLGKTFAGLS